MLTLCQRKTTLLHEYAVDARLARVRTDCDIDIALWFTPTFATKRLIGIADRFDTCYRYYLWVRLVDDIRLESGGLIGGDPSRLRFYSHLACPSMSIMCALAGLVALLLPTSLAGNLHDLVSLPATPARLAASVEAFHRHRSVVSAR